MGTRQKLDPDAIPESNDRATLAFAAALSAAILNGTERDRAPAASLNSDIAETALQFQPPAELPSDGPAKPQRGKSLWRRLAYFERRQAMAERAAARLAPLRARPSFDCLAVTDLTDETCRYPHGEKMIYFCGRAPECGPYCADHARICFVELANS